MPWLSWLADSTSMKKSFDAAGRALPRASSSRLMTSSEGGGAERTTTASPPAWVITFECFLCCLSFLCCCFSIASTTMLAFFLPRPPNSVVYSRMIDRMKSPTARFWKRSPLTSTRFPLSVKT